MPSERTKLQITSAHEMQRSRPARISEKVKRHMAHPRQAVGSPRLRFLVVRSLERPVIKQRSAHNILPGNKSPKPGVCTVVPVIAHHEVLALRHYEFAVF